MQRNVIVGAGSWGTALAVLLGSKNTQVTLFARNSVKASYMQEFRENKTYLPGVKIPPAVHVTSDWHDIKDADIYILAVPSHMVMETARLIKASNSAGKSILLINAAKGFDERTGHLISVEMRNLLESGDAFAVLSGPSHAEEVGRLMPTAVVAASSERAVAQKVQELFMADSFRVYTNDDIAGVEIAGATKNIIAIAAGINEGLGFGDNSSAALVTRGLHEITRLGLAMGAKQETFSGLAGLGDLMVTCNSMHSRNRRCGIALGKNKNLNEILDELGMVVEGIKATSVTKKLSEYYQIDMPIVDEVFQIIFEHKDPKETVLDLMLRERKGEAISEEEQYGDY